MCLCVCVCVREREKERKRERGGWDRICKRKERYHLTRINEKEKEKREGGRAQTGQDDIKIATDLRSYYEDAEQRSFPEFVGFGIPEFILEKSGDCRYFGMTDLTSDPTSGAESCEFYLSEVGRNSSEIALMECSTEELIYDNRWP